MGEIAESMINGEMCSQCGEYLGGWTGYPRKCSGCQQDDAVYSRKHEVKGIKNYLNNNTDLNHSEYYSFCIEYLNRTTEEIWDGKSWSKVARKIQSNFGEFVKHVNKMIKKEDKL